MKEHSIAISASLLFHVVIVALFLRVPFDQYMKPKLMVLDFSLERGRALDSEEIVNRKSEIVNRKSEVEDREVQHRGPVTDYKNTTIEQEHNVQRGVAAEPSGNSNTIVSDPAGQVAVRGEAGPMGTKADRIPEKNIVSGDSHNRSAVSGGIRVIDYGKGGSGVNDFLFIADTINKRFKGRYPDRASRMGWEGEVLLSFVISENGTIYDVKIVNSSGRRIFDDDAMKTLIKTTFNEKLPYSLKIENWRVTYKLQ